MRNSYFLWGVFHVLVVVAYVLTLTFHAATISGFVFGAFLFMVFVHAAFALFNFMVAAAS